MFGSLGGPEILFIFALALLLFGPRQLPKIGRTFGRTLAEFRKATQDFKAGLEREIEVEELKKTQESVTAAARDVGGALRDVAGVAERDGKEGVRPGDSASTSGSVPAGESAENADTQVVDIRDTRRSPSRRSDDDSNPTPPDPDDDAGTGPRP